MADWGIKVSLPGEDVSSDDDRDIGLTSALSYPKVNKNADNEHFFYDTYTFSSDAPVGVTNIVTVPHGYTYTPASISIFSLSRTIGGVDVTPDFRMAPSLIAIGGSGGVDYMDAYCDAENYYLDLYRTQDGAPGATIIDLTGETIKYKYEIFAENGA